MLFSLAERDALILDHLYLVRIIAGRLARRLPSSVDVGELNSVGTVGLIDAIDRFDPTRGVPFKGFADIRIRGSMVDYLRAIDPVSRAVRRKYDRLEHKRSELRNRLGRAPTRDEMARGLELSVDDYDSMLDQARLFTVVSGDTPTDEDGGTTIVDQVSAGGPSVVDAWIEAELTEEIVTAIGHLPEKERLVITKFYLESRTLKEIGAELGFTESRACQLAKQGTIRMRQRLGTRN
ncbi:MAG: FliA/WhiG family RNA polymerase sigma factor [Myxococcales bacterium]|nr:FliA/WhiG family RNA polymerase sigma factor [Myxococcales bacterium]